MAYSLKVGEISSFKFPEAVYNCQSVLVWLVGSLFFVFVFIFLGCANIINFLKFILQLQNTFNIVYISCRFTA